MKDGSNNSRFWQSVLGVFGSVVVFTLTSTAGKWLGPDELDLSPSPYSESLDARVSSNTHIHEKDGVDPVLAHSTVQDFNPPQDSAEMLLTGDAKKGGRVYVQFCGACHGFIGQARIAGMQGSDLFDGVSDRPSDPQSLKSIIEDGLLEDGMLPMKAVLNPEQIKNLVSYILENQPVS